MNEAVDDAVRISRELEPELWAKIDAVAEMIDPGAFAEYYRSTDPAAAPDSLHSTRKRYMQSKARNTASAILRYLKLAPEHTDWAPILQRMHEEARTPPDSDGAPGSVHDPEAMLIDGPNATTTQHFDYKAGDRFRSVHEPGDSQ